MGQQQGPTPERSALLRAMGVVTVCGLDIAVCCVLGILGGLFIDSHLHLSPWGLVAGLAIGLAAGIYSVYLIIAPIVRSI